MGKFKNQAKPRERKVNKVKELRSIFRAFKKLHAESDD